MPEETQVSDVSRFQLSRRGDAVTLERLPNLAAPRPEASHLTLHADRDDFHVSIPLGPILEQGLVVYKVGMDRLGIEQGGVDSPLDQRLSRLSHGRSRRRANVKYLSRIELSVHRGRDTRPSTMTPIKPFTPRAEDSTQDSAM